MTKREFLMDLRMGLAGLPPEDIEDRIAFYGEMIDDRMDDGLTEEAAVAEIGPVDAVIAQIMADIPLSRLLKERVRPKRTLRAWEVVFLLLGAPMWLPLLLAAACVLLALYIAMWAVIIALYAVDLSLAATGVAGIMAIFAYVSNGNLPGAAALFGAGLVCAGLAMLLFFAFNRVAKGILRAGKGMLLSIKYLFAGRREAR